MFPLAVQIIFLSKLDHMTPEILSNFPNHWLIYFTHSFNPTILVVALVIMYYSRNKVLQNALMVWFSSILQRWVHIDYHECNLRNGIRSLFPKMKAMHAPNT